MPEEIKHKKKTHETMRLKTIIKMALKNLWSHRARSIVTILGVTIGVASIIFLVSLGYGLEQLVTNQVSNFSEFSIIDIPAANISTLKIDQSIVDKVGNIGHVTTVSGIGNLAGRIKKEDSSSATETVISGASSDYFNLAGIQTDNGNLPADKDGIVVNAALATLLGQSENDLVGKSVKLDLLVPQSLTNQTSGDEITAKENVPFKIVGTISDNTAPIVYLNYAALVAEGVTNFSSLKVKVDDRANIDTVRQQLDNIGLSTEYVGDTVSEITRVFSLFRIILGAFGLIALIVAALGTFNTLTVSLLERTREIGLLKALGLCRRDTYLLFISEALIIGTLGGVVGLALGGAVGQLINYILHILANRAHADSVALFITPWIFSVIVAAFSILVGFATGWYPARRAVKLNPLDALRYE
ncbi:MAG: ABC transporter permease [Candidatus Berkelbacteria bacterium]|nr:ABC transporter permease [Candidatus Berkelbacteria bacterium]